MDSNSVWFTLAAFLPLFLFSLGCASSMPKDEYNYPLRAHDITESTPSSPLAGAEADLRRSARFSYYSKKIAFNENSSELTSTTKEALDSIAEEMRYSEDSFEKVRISGFNEGTSPAKNFSLSQARAENVRKYLISKGVKQEKLESFGMGAGGSEDSPNTKSAKQDIDFEIVQ